MKVKKASTNKRLLMVYKYLKPNNMEGTHTQHLWNEESFSWNSIFFALYARKISFSKRCIAYSRLSLLLFDSKRENAPWLQSWFERKSNLVKSYASELCVHKYFCFYCKNDNGDASSCSGKNVQTTVRDTDYDEKKTCKMNEESEKEKEKN